MLRLRKIETSEANGPDNIPNQVLKECTPQLAEGLTCILQKSVDTENLTEDWTHANVALVFKKADKHLVKNYYPASLTSVTWSVNSWITSFAAIQEIT